MGHYLFFFLAFLTLLSALCVVFSRSPIHSVLYLVLCFFTIAGHYVLLNAQFLAIVHIIVYAGAIMVLFLFTIMLLNLNKSTEPRKKSWVQLAGVISGGILALVLLGAVKSVMFEAPEFTDGSIGLVRQIGMKLFTDFLLPFEVASLLFLSAMIGVVMISKKPN